MENTQSTPPVEAHADKALAESAGYAGDHSGLKCEDVIKYLRGEACRDVPEPYPPRYIVAMLRATADYLEMAYPHIVQDQRRREQQETQNAKEI